VMWRERADTRAERLSVLVRGHGSRRRWGVRGVVELGDAARAGVLGRGLALVLGAGERERGVVGGVEELEVREPVGEA